tara:strand:+ start:8267 stop:9760 length:1494 start_codon:yes stop_codon:yes gene_type:complete
MSKIQKYIKSKEYENGGTMLPQVNLSDTYSGTSLAPIEYTPPIAQPIMSMSMPPEAKTYTAFGQTRQDIGNLFRNRAPELTPGGTSGVGDAAMAVAAIGTGLETMSDDFDPTTLNFGEASGSVLKGVGKGAALGATLGTVVPGVGNLVGAGVGATVGAITNIIGSITGRNKARKQAQKEYEDAMYESRGTLEKQFGQKFTQESATRSEEAITGQIAASEKYGFSYKKGGEINSEPYLKFKYKSGGHGRTHSPTKNHSSRPVDLKKEKYEDGGSINSMEGTDYQKLGTKQGIKHGVKTGINSGTKYMASRALITAGLQKFGTKFIPGVGTAWLAGDVGYYGTGLLANQYAKGHSQVYGPTLDDYEKKYGKDSRDKLEATTHTYGVSGLGTGFSAKFNEGGEVSYDVNDYLNVNYETGGMTKGEFSHKTNPLTVVDKEGNDTGMELTGGEGVFDKGAMSKLDKYKATKNYEKAGKLVFSEMNSWKDAGTAKYGTRIKYK